jgi:hypothetical protein
MKKHVLVYLLAAGLVLPAVAWAQDGGGQSLTIFNRLGVEYDDNIRQTETDESDSLKVTEEIQLMFNLNLGNTLLSARYRPSFTWWENRDEDSSDFYHDLTALLNHRFSERLTLGVKNNFVVAQLPEAIEGGNIVRQEGDYSYYNLESALMVGVSPVSRLDVTAGYRMLSYDDDNVALQQDYDAVKAGVTFRHNLVPETALLAVGGVEDFSYDEPGSLDRGAMSYQGGVGVQHTFSPNFLADVTAGYMNRDFEDDRLDDESVPFLNAKATLSPSPDTRITLGAEYSLLEADIFPYAAREALTLRTAVGFDVTARVTLNVSASYSDYSYDAANALPNGVDPVADGSEDVLRFAAGAAYKLNRSNWLEASWSTSSLSSDLREDYDRNRIALAWRTQL